MKNINGETKDLSKPLSDGDAVSVITPDTEDGLYVLRHSTAHVLAQAVLGIWEGATYAIGPPIKDGFYYDFLFQKPISEEDFPKIEKEMKKIISSGAKIKKILRSKEDAIHLFEKRNENYKIDIIKNAGQENDFAIYCQDDTDFIDLCKGPHLPSLKFIGAFKLTKISGAYWRGDSKNEMLQRIYGTAWKNQKDLDLHLSMLEEAERRDHRLLGKKNGFVSFSRRSPRSSILAFKRMDIISKINKLYETKTR